MKALTCGMAIAVLVALGPPAAATDVSGDQSGTWTLSQSPYELVGDVRVPPGQTLIIEPGVVVRAKGLYKFTVEQGTLRAVGTAVQPILMTAENHTIGWRGLRLLQADNGSVVSRCTIEYARPTGDWQEVRGGAIRCMNCSPTIAYNELRFNYCHNSNANGTGGGVMVESSSAWVFGNFIHDNYADSGGGICCAEYGTPVIFENTIVDNDAPYAGGGIYVGARSSALITNNVIMGNWAGGWGGGGINSWTAYIFYGTFCTIRNNVIAQNTTSAGGNAAGGGGIYCRYDRAVVSHNVIADNQAGQGGGIYAINYPDQAPLVTHCILWGNTAPSGPHIYLYPDTGSAISVQYSDVAGGWPGAGNLNANPLFADPANGDYHLLPGSPCIETGDPGFTPVPGETDIDGQMRIWDGDGDGIARVDMGSDEFGSYRYGDLNCDGVLNAFDIDPFVLALTDPPAYAAAFPACQRLLADANGDGVVNAFDIDPFVARLTGP